MHISGALTCIWWMVIGFVANRMLPPRPSPPLPAEENYFTYSWKKGMLYELGGGEAGDTGGHCHG